VSPSDYLTQLEQGRAKAPSPQVLTALSRALRLSNLERTHLFFLAGQSPQDSTRRDQAVPDSLRRMVRQLPGNPAAIYDPSWSPITWNSMWATIFGDPNERPVRERNKVWRYFTGLPTRSSGRLRMSGCLRNASSRTCGRALGNIPMTSSWAS
jgi:hypothetical protein